MIENPECDGDGTHRRILMRWRIEHNAFWCRRCNFTLALDEISHHHNRRVTAHNAMRDALAANYDTLPPLTCLYCGKTERFPSADVKKIEHFVRTPGATQNYIADVAALNVSQLAKNGGVVCYIEVIDSNPPRSAKLKLQEAVKTFYLRPQPINGDNLYGYDSASCFRQANTNQPQINSRKQI